MKSFFTQVFILMMISPLAMAVQKAKIFSEVVEIYSEPDFDAEVMDEVRAGETYFISDKTFGPFYRIKLKSGKIGYIVDYEVEIEGKGRVKAKDLDAILLENEKKIAGENPEEIFDPEEQEEAELFGAPRAGPSIQLINFHENTLGSDQVDNLLGIGYKSVSDKSWSVLGVFKAPKYYETAGAVSGFKLWTDIGFSSPIVMIGASEIRYAATLFAHASVITLTTPTRKYNLQDLTAGLALEVGWMFKIRSSAIDLAIKYYFDKTPYAGFGLSYLF